MRRGILSTGGAPFVGVVLALAVFARTSNGQESPAATPKVNYACLIPSSRTAYRIREADPKQECSSPEHVMFNWNEGSPPPIQVPIDEKKTQVNGGDVASATSAPRPDSTSASAPAPAAPVPVVLPAGSLSAFEVVSNSTVKFKPQLADGTDPRAVFVAAIPCPAGKTVLGGSYEFRDAAGNAISRTALGELVVIGTSIGHTDAGVDQFAVTIDNPQAVAVTVVMQATCATVQK